MTQLKLTAAALIFNWALFETTQLINQAISSFCIQLLIVAPMIIIPALYLSTAGFYVCAFLSGLWIDTALPIPIGPTTTFFLFIGTILRTQAIQRKADQLVAHSGLSQIVNLLFLLFVTAFSKTHPTLDTHTIIIISSTVISSQLVLWIIEIEVSKPLQFYMLKTQENR